MLKIQNRVKVLPFATVSFLMDGSSLNPMLCPPHFSIILYHFDSFVHWTFQK